MKLYVLWHIHELTDDTGVHDEEKMIGIYSTEEKAAEAIEAHKDLEGFRDYPVECFEVHETVVDRSNWNEGFTTVRYLEESGSDRKEITLEKAKSIADMYLKGITHCVEYEDAFWFSNRKSSLSFGGMDSPVIILKENGKVISAASYVDIGAGEIIREYDYRSC